MMLPEYEKLLRHAVEKFLSEYADGIQGDGFDESMTPSQWSDQFQLWLNNETGK